MSLFGRVSCFTLLLFASLLLGCPPCSWSVYYVDILGVCYCRFESEGGHIFSNVIVFTESSFSYRDTFINSFTFSPILLSCFLLRGRSIGLGQGLNWLRPGWTYPSRPPPCARFTDKEGSPSSRQRSWRASTESKFDLGRSSGSSPDEFKS